MRRLLRIILYCCFLLACSASPASAEGIDVAFIGEGWLMPMFCLVLIILAVFIAHLVLNLWWEKPRSPVQARSKTSYYR